MTVRAQASSGGFELQLDLADTDLLPGRLVDGTLTIATRDDKSIRAARVTLAGTERWRHDVTTTDANGNARTRRRPPKTSSPVPIQVLGPTTFGPGETRAIPFQVPVPGLDRRPSMPPNWP